MGLLDLSWAFGVGDLDRCLPKSGWWLGLPKNFLCGVGLLDRLIFRCSSMFDCCCCLPAGWWGVGDRDRLLETLLAACSCVDCCWFCIVPAHEPTLDAELRRVLGGDLRISSRIFFSDALGAGDYASWPFLYTLCHLFNKLYNFLYLSSFCSTHRNFGAFAFNSFLRIMLFVTNFGIFAFSRAFEANTHFAYPSITKWIPRFRFT